MCVYVCVCVCVCVCVSNLFIYSVFSQQMHTYDLNLYCSYFCSMFPCRYSLLGLDTFQMRIVT